MTGDVQSECCRAATTTGLGSSNSNLASLINQIYLSDDENISQCTQLEELSMARRIAYGICFIRLPAEIVLMFSGLLATA